MKIENIKNEKKRLFSSYEFVISGHFWFNRFPAGIEHLDSFVSIKQKIDSKCYVGIRKSSQKWINIEYISMYNGELFLNYEKELLNSHYNQWLKILESEMNLDEKSHGYEIAVVSESTRWEWLWFTGTVFSLIVTGIGILNGKYKPNILDDYESFESSTQFHEIKTLAHKCSWKIKHGNSGPSYYTTLLQTAHPHVYLSDSHDIQKLDDIQFIKEYYQTIPKMLNLKDISSTTLPIRWAMIYTWQRANTNMVENQRKFTRMKNKNYSERFSKQNWDDVYSNLHKIFSTNWYYEIITNAISAMSIKTLYLFSHIYQYWPRREYIFELINHFNTIHSLYNDIEEDSDIVDDFFSACAQKNISPDMFGMFPIYTSKFGGNYVIIFEDDSDYDILEIVIENMRSKYPHIRIASKYNFDTPPSQWVKIEQNLFNYISSENAEDVYMMIDNFWEQKFCNYVDINPEETTWLFLDAVKWKVYFNGKSLTSKDIKSQSTTIEIFDMILQSPDLTIKNNQLWPSTFSGQQNQMLGKIIYPLNKFIYTNSGQEFPFESTWSLREFWLKLGKTNIPVVLVKKVA